MSYQQTIQLSRQQLRLRRCSKTFVNWLHPKRAGNCYSRVFHSESVYMRIKTFYFRLAAVAVLLGSLSGATGQQQIVKLRSAGTIVGAGSYSFPEKITLDGRGNLYLFDSSLSNVFVVNARRGTQVTTLCSPRTPVAASDLSVERGGEVWILDSIASKIIKLDRNCKAQKSFVVRHPALALQVNSSGEVVVLTSVGGSLFDVYDQSGTLLRSFGQRFS